MVMQLTGGGGGGASNVNRTYQFLTAATVTSGAINTKGSWQAIGTSLASEIQSFQLIAYSPSASTDRYLMDISTDGGTTTLMPDIYLQPGNSPAQWRANIPLRVAAGLTISVRTQSSSATSNLTVAAVGAVRQSSDPPGFTQTELPNAADNTNTLANTGNVVLGNPGSYLGRVNTTNAWGAFMITGSGDGSIGTTGFVTLRIGFGATGSEVELYSVICNLQNSMTSVMSPVVQTAIPAGTKTNYAANASFSENVRMQVFGFF